MELGAGCFYGLPLQMKKNTGTGTVRYYGTVLGVEERKTRTRSTTGASYIRRSSAVSE